MLAHEEDGDGGGETAEGAGVGAYVDVVPCSRVGEAGLDILLAIDNCIDVY